MSQISDRFQRSRWSPVRQRIDAMKPGEKIEFPPSAYYNAKSSVERCNDAYDGERPRWVLHKQTTATVVTHGRQVLHKLTTVIVVTHGGTERT